MQIQNYITLWLARIHSFLYCIQTICLLHFKRDLISKFEMIYIGLMHYFLGLEVWREDAHIFLGQGKYARDKLRRFHMEDRKLMATLMINNQKKLHVVDSKFVDPTLYNQLIGMLMYLVNTRPYICFAVNTLSQFMVEPMRVHWVVVKRVVVPTGYIGLWNVLYLGRWSQVDQLHILGLGKQCQ